MQKRALGFVLFLSCLAFSVAAERERPAFIFGGKELYVGMFKRDAVAALSDCCKLSPPPESNVEARSTPGGMTGGHFIFPKDESSGRILGAVFFSGGKVQRVTRPLAQDVDSQSDDVVGFARAIKRSLPDGQTHALVFVRHERASNAESDVVVLRFPNGRGVEIRIGTLDKPDEYGKRDFATLDETLQPSRE